MPDAGGALGLTARQAEVLALVTCGLGDKQIARYLGISVRTVGHHLAALRQRTGTRNRTELTAWAAAVGLICTDPDLVPAAASPQARGDRLRFRRRADPVNKFRDGVQDQLLVKGGVTGVRIGYARVCTRDRDHQAQLAALASADCHEIVVETASVCDGRPELQRAFDMLHTDDTLVIYKPDRLARSVKELLILLMDQLHARGINLHILSGACAGLYRPDGTTVADKMLFLVAEMAAEMERDLVCERAHDSSCTVPAQGRPRALNQDKLAIAHGRRERGESVTTIARDLGIGRSTLYRALQSGRRGTGGRWRR